ncbi:MAG: hypothetical protein J6S85_00945 [Methanobrevibacter sp.]|nr:hypothetical protein [Methanobrevibacter sp.]MBO7712099.1 hypothetical protein [Methanobrevibacter sp.]
MKAPNEANIDTMLSKTKGYVDNEISKVNNELDDKQDKLTAGTNITIDANNVISASGGLTEVTAGDVNSEQATQGQVLTADGSGGASWQNASGGNKYMHIINCNFNVYPICNIIIINSSNTAFTASSLANYLYTNGISNTGLMPIINNHAYYHPDGNKKTYGLSVYGTSSGELKLQKIEETYDFTNGTIATNATTITITDINRDTIIEA